MCIDKKIKSLFILGAGASVDHGYPTGQALLNDIVNFLDNKKNIFGGSYSNGFIKNRITITTLLILKKHRDHRRSGSNEDFYNEFIYLNEKDRTTDVWGFRDILKDVNQFHEKLKYSYTRSIDDFMHSQLKSSSNTTDIGKFLIVSILLQYERKSLNFNSDKDGNYKYKSSFYTDLWRSLYGLNFEDFKSNLQEIKFISFNYDRLLEDFLFTSASNFYNEDPIEVGAVLNDHLKVHHVYGRLPSLRWEGNQVGTCYGEEILKKIYGTLNKVLVECGIIEDNLDSSNLRDFKNAIGLLTGTNTFTRNFDLDELWRLLNFFFDSIDSVKTYGEKHLDNFRVDLPIEKMYFLGFSFHELNKMMVLSQYYSCLNN